MSGQATVTIRDRQWPAYLATTYAELTTGLKGVAALPAGTGMLFMLSREQLVTVTMQGVLFPLDIVFISAQLHVVDVGHAIPPGVLVTQHTPIRYFLEVNAGEAEGVQIGDAVAIQVARASAAGGDWMSPVVSFAAVAMTGLFMVNMGKTMADAMQDRPVLYVPRGERLLPQAAGNEGEAKPMLAGPGQARAAKEDVEFLPDSPEFLAYTIDDIGYRERMDGAFLQAIARARGKRQ